jgi:hypothetical protein
MKINRYTFDNGKYEVHSADDGSSLVAYRHGEFWQNMIGDNLTAAMLHRIDELEAKIKDVTIQAYEEGLMDGANK